MLKFVITLNKRGISMFSVIIVRIYLIRRSAKKVEYLIAEYVGRLSVSNVANLIQIIAVSNGNMRINIS